MNGCAKVVQVKEVMTMPDPTIKKLSRFGFSFEKGSIQLKRTMMLKELVDVFDFVQNANAATDVYFDAIYNENCTGKKSGTTRKATAHALKKFYLLDPSFCIFRALRFFWERDVVGRALTAFLCAFVKDSILRETTDYVLGLSQEDVASKDDLYEHIERVFPDRFSPVMRASLARNLLSSWTQAGYLKGRRKKVRQRPEVSPGSVSFALLLGYLVGERGEMIFSSRYAKLLDCPAEQAFNMAEDASRRGWLVFKRVGNVIEVAFPSLLTSEEMGWLRE